MTIKFATAVASFVVHVVNIDVVVVLLGSFASMSTEAREHSK
jgi:hypothetical protein